MGDKKAKGKKIIEDADEGGGKGSNVVDLMAALRKSMGGTDAKAPAKKPAAKKPATAKPAAKEPATKKPAVRKRA